MDTTTTATHISFTDRHTAEKFYYNVGGGKTIPGVEGQVELAWATTPSSVAVQSTDRAVQSKAGLTAAAAAAAALVNAPGDEAMTDSVEGATPNGEEAQMDFESTAENEWDI